MQNGAVIDRCQIRSGQHPKIGGAASPTVATQTQRVSAPATPGGGGGGGCVGIGRAAETMNKSYVQEIGVSKERRLNVPLLV